MTSGDKNGILVIAVKRGNEINIEYSKKEIVNKINSYFGYKLINNIKLQTFNHENKKRKKKISFGNASKNLEKKINSINNKNIKNSLSNLLRTIENE